MKMKTGPTLKKNILWQSELRRRENKDAAADWVHLISFASRNYRHQMPPRICNLMRQKQIEISFECHALLSFQPDARDCGYLAREVFDKKTAAMTWTQKKSLNVEAFNTELRKLTGILQLW